MTDVRPETLARYVERAKSAIGSCDYKLRKGGWSGIAPYPGQSWQDPKTGRKRTSCDCSGFVAWVLGRSRRPQPTMGKWWFSTDVVWRDALGTLTKTAKTQRQMFKQVDLADARAGDIVVYPDQYSATGRQLSEGHIAVLVDVEARLIVDCSSSRNGVTQRGATPFFDMVKEGKPLRGDKHQVICRYNPAGWP